MNSSTALVVRSGPEDAGGETRMEKELSVDDIIEIFARLPVKSLMRFRCLSKLWCNLILSPNFIAVHSSHNPSKNKKVTLWLSSSSCNYTVTDNPITTVNFQFGEVTENLTLNQPMGLIKMVGCFNGVVCLSLSCLSLPTHPQKYALWNPATRHVRVIGGAPMDDPDVRNMAYSMAYSRPGLYDSGFCFDPVTNAFKVVQMKLYATEERGTRAQVNVFSTATNSWTEKKNIAVPYRIHGGVFQFIKGGTCLNGYMYWHVTIFQGIFTLVDMYILSYNVIDEVFQRIEMPPSPNIVNEFDYRLAAYKGSLAIFRTRSVSSHSEVDVFVTNENGGSDQSWSKLLTIKPAVKVRRALGFFRKGDVDLILLSSELGRSVYLYDPENEETNRFLISRPMSDSFLYSESLASLN